MSLNLKDAKKGLSSTLAPIGNHIARCYQLVDLGTQDDTKYGNASHKLRFAWELCEELHDFGRGKEPFSVSMTVNFFIGRSSNFTKLLEGWRGGTLTDEYLEKFELKRLVGKACMVNVVHATVGDREYANVASVSPVPDRWKDRVPAIHNPPVFFEVEMGPQSEQFKALPDFLKKMIEKCHEWQGTSVAPAPDEDDPFDDDDEAPAGPAVPPEEDDIPFAPNVL